MSNKIECLKKAIEDIINDFENEPMGLKRSEKLNALAERFGTYEKICLELANKNMGTLLFEPGARVLYIKRKEEGVVSSINENFVFVKFDYLIPDGGLDCMNGQACSPKDLLILEPS